MTGQSVPSVGLFYSRGPHFAKTLHRLREAYPDARITAIVPAGFPVAEQERKWVDEIVVTERAHYSPRDVAASMRLIARLRKARYGLFVVMFPSAQLGILASLCGARRRACAPPQGTLIPMYAGPLRTVAGECARRILGGGVYLALLAIVRFAKIRA